MAGRKTDDAYARDAILALIAAVRAHLNQEDGVDVAELGEEAYRQLEEAARLAEKIDRPLRRKEG